MACVGSALVLIAMTDDRSVTKSAARYSQVTVTMNWKHVRGSRVTRMQTVEPRLRVQGEAISGDGS